MIFLFFLSSTFYRYARVYRTYRVAATPLFCDQGQPTTQANVLRAFLTRSCLMRGKLDQHGRIQGSAEWTAVTPFCMRNFALFLKNYQ